MIPARRNGETNGATFGAERAAPGAPRALYREQRIERARKSRENTRHEFSSRERDGGNSRLRSPAWRLGNDAGACVIVIARPFARSYPRFDKTR